MNLSRTLQEGLYLHIVGLLLFIVCFNYNIQTGNDGSFFRSKTGIEECLNDILVRPVHTALVKE